MDRLSSRRIITYLACGGIVLVGGIWGLVASGGSAGASEVLLVQGEAASSDGAAPAAAGASSASSETTESLIFIQVAGAVRRPGVYQLPARARVFEALERAGGVLDGADAQALPLAAPLQDGVRVFVPAAPGSAGLHTESPGQSDGSSTSGSFTESPSLGSPPALGTTAKISLSAATQAELETLPGVGPALALRIIQYREENGRFATVDELDEVSGIGPAIMGSLRDLVVP